MVSVFPLYREVEEFVDGSASGLLQLLVAAARRTTFDRIIDCPTYPTPVKASMLGEAVQHLREALRRPDIHAPTFLARLYASVRPMPHRKGAGQFFTSDSVAVWAVSLARLKPVDDVCDAGAGTGVFATAIAQSKERVRSYVGVENDATLALCVAHVLDASNAPASFRVWYANFLLLDQDAFTRNGLRAPSVIVANPPFVRAWNLAGRMRLQTKLKAKSGLRLPHLSGSANYFLLKAAELATSSTSKDLTGESRLIFLFPSEAAGAAHAKRLRADLQRVYGFTWREYRLPTNSRGVDRLASSSLALCFVFERGEAQLTPRLVYSPSARVGDYIQINRGVSTGRNEFFVMTEEVALQRAIPRSRLVPVLPTRIPIADDQFSKEDWEALRKDGYPCWLLALPSGKVSDFEASVQSYLREGIRKGVHSTPTAERLRSWFALPIPATPPDVFVTYLFRGTPRFILNSARVFNLTNILAGRFRHRIRGQGREHDCVSALNRQAGNWSVEELGGREYRGGLRKIEPRELSMLSLTPFELTPYWSVRQASSTPSLFD